MTELWRGEERKARDLIVTNYVKAIRTALELLDADPPRLVGWNLAFILGEIPAQKGIGDECV